MINYDAIQIGLTTHCNMRCPDCSWGVPKIKHRHTSWEELQEIAKCVYGTEKIYIMGGEPTVHPNFVEWSPKLREMFGCSNLILWTNGYGFKKFPEIFSEYNWVIISRYNEKIYKGCPDNSSDIDFIFDYYKKKFGVYTIGYNEANEFCSLKGLERPFISLGESPHIPLLKVEKKGTGCGRMLLPAYKDGLLYPCCAGTYLEEAKGIKPTENWKEEVQKVELPCKYCIFTEE